MFWTGFWLLTWALLILLLGVVAASWLGALVRAALERSRVDPSVRHLGVSVVRPLVLVIALIAGLNLLGVDLTAVVAILGAATLAIGLAMRDSLANVAAGAVLLTLRPYTGDDWVEAGGTAGTVAELGLMATTLKDARGVMITVPNQLILRAPIQNYTRNGLRRADLTFRVGPAADLGAAREAILAALRADERVLEEPPPFVRVSDIDQRGVDLLVAAWLKSADFHGGRSDLAEGIRAALWVAEVPLASRHLAVLSDAK